MPEPPTLVLPIGPPNYNPSKYLQGLGFRVYIGELKLLPSQVDQPRDAPRHLPHGVSPSRKPGLPVEELRSHRNTQGLGFRVYGFTGFMGVVD